MPSWKIENRPSKIVLFCSLLVEVLLIISLLCVKWHNNLSSLHTSLVVFPKALFSTLYSSSCTLLLSVIWSLPFPLATTFMTLSCSSPFTHSFFTFKTLFNRSLPGWLLIFLFLSHLKLNSCSLDSKTNLLEMRAERNSCARNITLDWIGFDCQNTELCTWHNPSSRNLDFIFSEHLTFSGQITSLSKACYYHIRQLHCIRPYLDSSTASTIAISIVHSTLDYCNSLYYKLPKSQLSRLQQIENSLACTVVKAPKSCHIAPILRSPPAQNHSTHWIQAPLT